MGTHREPWRYRELHLKERCALIRLLKKELKHEQGCKEGLTSCPIVPRRSPQTIAGTVSI